MQEFAKLLNDMNGPFKDGITEIGIRLQLHPKYYQFLAKQEKPYCLGTNFDEFANKGVIQ